MDAKYFIRILRKYCTNIYIHCAFCPFNFINTIDSSTRMNCERYIINNPALAERRIVEICSPTMMHTIEKCDTDINFIEYANTCVDICRNHKLKNNTCNGCVLKNEFCRILHPDGVDILKRAGKISSDSNINYDELLIFLDL